MKRALCQRRWKSLFNSSHESSGKRRKRNSPLQREIWELYFIKLGIWVLTCYITFHFLLGIVEVNGISMEPTLQEEDILLTTRIGYQLNRGDIVICHSGKGLQEELVKRVVGLPGDTIDIIDEKLYVNGKQMEEPYIKEPVMTAGETVYPTQVPPGEYFVMGDNRNQSLDSRSMQIGTIPRKGIEGKVLLRVFPFLKVCIF